MKKLPSHHAIFVEGNAPDAISFFHSGLVERGMKPAGNPDVMFLHFDNLGIDEARELIATSLNAPIANDKKIIILSFQRITSQAQNALLKLFEDPNPKSEFLITSTNTNILLPTLRSRLFVIKLDMVNGDIQGAKKFITLTLGDRLKEIDRMLKRYKDSGDRSEIRDFLIALHHELERNPKENAEALSASAFSLTYIDATSSSVKLLLESVALNIP